MRFSEYSLLTFAANLKRTLSSYMDNIQNTRGKGYCILYLVMFLLFFTALVLMLCNRGSLVDFPR